MSVTRKANMKDCIVLAKKVAQLNEKGLISNKLTAQQIYDEGRNFYQQMLGQVEMIVSKNPFCLTISKEIYRRVFEAWTWEYNYFDEEGEELSFRSRLLELESILYDEESYTLGMDNPIQGIKKIPMEYEEMLLHWLKNSQEVEDERTNSQYPHPWAVVDFIEEMEGKRKFSKSLSLKDIKKQDLSNDEKWDKVNNMAYSDPNYWVYRNMTKELFYENKRVGTSNSAMMNTKAHIEKLLGINNKEDTSRQVLDQEWTGEKIQILKRREVEEVTNFYYSVVSTMNSEADDNVKNKILEGDYSPLVLEIKQFKKFCSHEKNADYKDKLSKCLKNAPESIRSEVVTRTPWSKAI